MIRKVIIGCSVLVFGLAAGWLSVVGLNSSVFSQSVGPPVITYDLVQTDEGVTVRLKTAVYSSTESVFTLELMHPNLQESRRGALFEAIRPADISVQGFASAKLKGQTSGRGEKGKEVREIVLDTAALPGAAVIEIKSLCLVKEDQLCDRRDGSWRFEFTPQLPSGDLVARSISLGQSRTIDDITVELTGMRLSSSETLVDFSIRGEGFDVKPAGASLELVQAGQRPIPAETKAGQVGRTASLPPVLLDAKTITLQTRGIVKNVGTAARVDFSLPAMQANVPAQGSLNHQFIVNSELLTIRDFTFDGKLLKLNIYNLSSPGSVLFSGMNSDFELLDSSGHSFPKRSRGVSFQREDSGRISAFSEHLTFEVSQLDAGSLTLMSRSIAEVVDGPWTFDVDVR